MYVCMYVCIYIVLFVSRRQLNIEMPLRFSFIESFFPGSSDD